jgi:hypothetical protein
MRYKNKERKVVFLQEQKKIRVYRERLEWKEGMKN